jgi:Transglycosylase-like domain
VRKLIASTLAISAMGVPAAFAAAADDGVGNTPPTKKLVSTTTLDKHWKHTKRVLKTKRKAARERGAQPDVAIPPQLEQIAQCESHGDPHAIGGGGNYRGKYQFDMGTWASVGGQGDPAAAPEAEQDKRAAMLYARTGPSQWPVCGG